MKYVIGSDTFFDESQPREVKTEEAIPVVQPVMDKDRNVQKAERRGLMYMCDICPAFAFSAMVST